MAAGGRRIALAVTADGEVELIRGLVDLLRPLLDRVVIAEATRTFQGNRREVRPKLWAADLGLDEAILRTVVTDLPAGGATREHMRERESLQRAAIGLAVRDLDPDDLPVAVDADEYVDPRWLAEHAARITAPTRMLLVPMYGGLDRRAPDWHCCRVHLSTPIGQWPPAPTGWLCPGGVVGPLAALDRRGVAGWRYQPMSLAGPAGWHLLHIMTPQGDPARKFDRQAHSWARTLDADYLTLMLDAGIHPYGWWAATAMPAPPELGFLVARHPGVIRGDLPPDGQREELMRLALERFRDVGDHL